MFTPNGVGLQSPDSSRGSRRTSNPHHGARLTVFSRERIVARIAAGQEPAEWAAAFGVSIRTVRRSLARFRAGGGAALSNRARTAPARPPALQSGWRRRRLR
ncbi:MAG: helix-turn-helix domain-containing protein [Rhodobacteraceae bacterium]|nr:helix-turn-helix domain-containing protein [Paracoccaceae bacterium]